MRNVMRLIALFVFLPIVWAIIIVLDLFRQQWISTIIEDKADAIAEFFDCRM